MSISYCYRTRNLQPWICSRLVTPILPQQCLTLRQRLKGAIDSRIAEEQARQRAAVTSASPSRSGSTAGRRSVSRNLSPSKRPKPSERAELSTGKGPDPSEFDSDFILGDDGARNGVPKGEVFGKDAEERKAVEPSVNTLDINMAPENGEAATPTEHGGEMSTEVRVKLRKLERLESKYQELLKAYRIAHAKVQTIEPFEASLRENTPLTSINDPGALLEYLNQITLKSDLVLDELKRVAAERDEYRKKLDESEKEAQALKGEVSSLKQQEQKSELATEPSVSDRQPYDLSNARESTGALASEPSTSAKSPTPSTSSRLPSFSLFSPKSKAVKSPQEQKDPGEEFFSYDNELPRIEAELQERQVEITDLKKQISTLQGDLSVTRESTEGMVQSLEAATQELHSLRDVNEKHQMARHDLQAKIERLEQDISSHVPPSAATEQQGSSVESQLAIVKVTPEEKDTTLSSMKKAEEERIAQVTALEGDLLELRERAAQKDATVKDLEDSLAMAHSAERQQGQPSRSESASQKQIGILNNIMESLRSQLKTAEVEITELKEVKRKAEIEIGELHELYAHNEMQEEARGKTSARTVDEFETKIAELPSMRYFGFVNSNEFSLSGDAPAAFRQFSEKVKITRPELYEALISPEKSNKKSVTPTELAVATNDNIKKSKKKRKKNKGRQDPSADPNIHEPPAQVTETLDEAEDEVQKLSPPQLNTAQHVEKQINDLQRQMEEKDATIDSLSGKLKDQAALNEEIETLRDDLLLQGEGHVEARDALKAARNEKSALEERVANLEKELTDLRAHSATSSAESENAHRDLLSELTELKVKSGAFQRDLAAAEQLAAARFKDITDLRELLSKAQPELRSLRAEVEELKPIREDLNNKIVELRRLESRHEDLKADMKSLSRKLGEKDSDIKDLRQSFTDASTTKMKVEEDLRTARSDLQNGEALRVAAVSSQKQTLEELSQTRADHNASLSSIRELEDAISKHVKEVQNLKDEVGLKTSLHESTQAIMAGLREQALELSTQAREASSRADSLEEELAEAQRMLSERSREGETMRRLLTDAEGRTATKIREMKERMETAIEERDRAEDEASTSNRRMAREIEDLRNKTREATRSLKAVEEEKEELERSQKNLKCRRDELEAVQNKSLAEVNEAQAAIQQLREALDQREREGMEFERQKTDMKRSLEDVQERVERLQKANKALTDELKGTQQQRKGSIRPPTGFDSEAKSSRSSLDSTGPNARNNSVIGSPVPNIRDRLPASRSSTPTGANASPIDYVYLKNVLLQFLEQKDKGHQKQLIPVLGMLLNFDR